VHHALPALAAWASFYNIVGSSAAALTGLQFVVIALAADRRLAPGPELEAFGTPTIVHFCAVLLVSAIISAPWSVAAHLALALTLAGAAGLAYAVIVTVRAVRQTGYAPVLEDWLWHSAFPLAAYVALTVASFRLEDGPAWTLFTVAAASLFLLFIAIHNAWDAVVYIAGRRSDEPAPPA
jgi:hypothetical protein